MAEPEPEKEEPPAADSAPASVAEELGAAASVAEELGAASAADEAAANVAPLEPEARELIYVRTYPPPPAPPP